jgi:hypothetical protein
LRLTDKSERRTVDSNNNMNSWEAFPSTSSHAASPTSHPPSRITSRTPRSSYSSYTSSRRSIFDREPLFGNDDIDNDPRRENYKSFKIGAGAHYHSARPRYGLTVESLSDKKTIQYYLVDLTNQIDKDQRLAQGITYVTADGRLVLRTKVEWVAHARENAGADLRSEKYSLLMKQVETIKVGADAQIAVLEIKSDAKELAVIAEHTAASERNDAARAKYAVDMDERDQAIARAGRSRSPSPVRATRARAAAGAAGAPPRARRRRTPPRRRTPAAHRQVHRAHPHLRFCRRRARRTGSTPSSPCCAG